MCRDGCYAMVPRAGFGHTSSQDGATALMAAAVYGHNSTVELLADRGADLEAKDEVIAAAALPRGGRLRASQAGGGPRWR